MQVSVSLPRSTPILRCARKPPALARAGRKHAMRDYGTGSHVRRHGYESSLIYFQDVGAELSEHTTSRTMR